MRASSALVSMDVLSRWCAGAQANRTYFYVGVIGRWRVHRNARIMVCLVNCDLSAGRFNCFSRFLVKQPDLSVIMMT